LDGRDTPPKSALGFLKDFENKIADLPGVRIATVSGRFYAMDRDKRWDRVSKAYDAIVSANGQRFDTAFAAVEASYAENVTDEFVIPTVIGDYAGAGDGDALLFGNFRADRAREISMCLLDPKFKDFNRERVVKFSAAAGLTEYSDTLNTMMGA